MLLNNVLHILLAVPICFTVYKIVKKLTANYENWFHKVSKFDAYKFYKPRSDELKLNMEVLLIL